MLENQLQDTCELSEMAVGDITYSWYILTYHVLLNCSVCPLKFSWSNLSLSNCTTYVFVLLEHGTRSKISLKPALALLN